MSLRISIIAYVKFSIREDTLQFLDVGYIYDFSTQQYEGAHQVPQTQANIHLKDQLDANSYAYSGAPSHMTNNLGNANSYVYIGAPSHMTANLGNL